MSRGLGGCREGGGARLWADGGVRGSHRPDLRSWAQELLGLERPRKEYPKCSSGLTGLAPKASSLLFHHSEPSPGLGFISQMGDLARLWAPPPTHTLGVSQQCNDFNVESFRPVN